MHDHEENKYMNALEMLKGQNTEETVEELIKILIDRDSALLGYLTCFYFNK